jgi:hypothetical protein
MTKKLLRRADVMDLLGISEGQFKKLLDAEQIKPIRLKRKSGRGWYRLDDVLSTFGLSKEAA